ncbi:MAG: tetratricopeptide repeat protein [Chitinophagaceae bacterium]|nr:tetratricopeptide repeat protein [Chitinophagaceae bacterium]
MPVVKYGKTPSASGTTLSGKDPNIIKGYGGRGKGYIDKQMYPEAIRDLNKALELKTDYSDAYYNRGLANYFLAKQNQDAGNMNEAMNYYELSIRDNSDAIKYNPQLARAYYNRSGNYFILKKIRSGIAGCIKGKRTGDAS